MANPGYFAERGFVVLSMDNRTLVDDDLGVDVAYPKCNALGRTLVGMWVWDAMRGLDLLAARPEVDPARIGCTGWSLGGNMANFVTMLDPRVKALCTSGYFSTFEDMLFRTAGSSTPYIPGITTVADYPELVFGLACPRPVYIQYGEQDGLYTPAVVRAAFRRGQRMYRAMGVAKRAELEYHAGGHPYRHEPPCRWLAAVL